MISPDRMRQLFEEGKTLKDLEETINLDTFEKLNKKLELCFGIGGNGLTDDYEAYIEDVISDIDLNSIQDVTGVLERAKRITVYKKHIFELTGQFLMEHVEDYLNDNWCYDGYEHGYLDDVIGKDFFDDIAKKFNKKFHWYLSGHQVCFLDLSKEIKEHIKRYYVEDIVAVDVEKLLKG